MRIDNIKSFTDSWRNMSPNLYKDKTDEEIFSLLRERHPNLGIPDYADALSNVPQAAKKRTSKSLNDEDTSPSWVNNWFTTGDFIPDSWQEEGFMGITSEFFQE